MLCYSVPWLHLVLQELSADARQGLQDMKEALQLVSVQRHTPALAAAVQQAPTSAAALPPQSAASTNVPEQLAAAHNEELKNRAPQYQHIPRNVYSRGVARPKRQPRDDIHVCSCRAPKGLFNSLPARQPTQRQANSTLHKQMLQKAAASAASAAPAVADAALPPLSSPRLDDQGPSGLASAGHVPATQGISDVRMTENAADQATPEGTQHDVADHVGMTPRSTAAATSTEVGGPDAEAVPAQELGCGEDCLNRLSFIHCDAKLCPCGASCTNRSYLLPWVCICPLSWLENSGRGKAQLILLSPTTAAVYVRVGFCGWSIVTVKRLACAGMQSLQVCITHQWSTHRRFLCRPFHQLKSPQVEVFLTTNRGWGVKAAEPLAKGTFIIEYAGERLELKPSYTCKCVIQTNNGSAVFRDPFCTVLFLLGLRLGTRRELVL